MRWIACGVMALAVSMAMVPKSAAQSVTMYRCTDALGRVTLQNDVPCPKGSQEERRSVDIDASAAPFPDMLPPAAPVAAAQPEPATEVAAGNDGEGTQSDFAQVLPLPDARTPKGQRLPPPPLFRCRTVENDTYLADTGEPRERCVAMDTVGIGGMQGLGAGQACSVVFDQCQRVPDEDACDAWRLRVNQAQSAWTFGRADSRGELKDAYERAARVVAETTCNE